MQNNSDASLQQIKSFQDGKIRSVWNEEEEQWYFSVVDVVQVLTNSVNPRDYWFKMKKRIHTDDGIELSTICRQLKLPSSDGKFYNTDCANVKSLLRIIQSIPSPKAEPFKQWLSQVGYERIQEIQNPELAQERMKELYEKKGYSKDWIDKRLRGIAIRQNLTDEWKERGITKEKDFAILTAEISKATFGLTPSEYKSHKGLTKKIQNLRDHMPDNEKSLLIGDFNANKIWDEKLCFWNFSTVNEILNKSGLYSFYHLQTGESFGKEIKSTFYLQRNKNKPYLIYYAYGRKKENKKLSDHCPIIIDLRD